MRSQHGRFCFLSSSKGYQRCLWSCTEWCHSSRQGRFADLGLSAMLSYACGNCPIPAWTYSCATRNCYWFWGAAQSNLATWTSCHWQGMSPGAMCWLLPTTRLQVTGSLLCTLNYPHGRGRWMSPWVRCSHRKFHWSSWLCPHKPPKNVQVSSNHTQISSCFCSSHLPLLRVTKPVTVKLN